MKIQGKTAAEIVESIRLLTLSQQFLPGHVLPPVRDLALQLNVNRNTVAAAYKRLVTAGIALTQGRLGTVIRHQENAGEQEGGFIDSPLIDLAGGNPHPDWLPDIAVALQRKSYRPRLYGAPLVDPELEAYGRQWFANDCPQEFAIDLTHGAVDAIERLLSAYLVAGDKVALESPGFLGSINTLRIAGMQAVGIPVDAEGMRADALESALADGLQAVILTPRAHNPTGCSLSEKRARSLSRVLARYPHVLVIVDDHFALLSSVAYHAIIPASTRHWAVIRSVSKALGPDLRLALVASDAQTSQRLRLRLTSGANWVSHVLQDVVVSCLASREVKELVLQAGDDYRRRRDLLMAALDQQGIACAAPAEGLNVWLPLEQDAQKIVLNLAQFGWLVRQGAAFFVPPAAHQKVSGIRISIANIDEASAQRFARDLRYCLAMYS